MEYEKHIPWILSNFVCAAETVGIDVSIKPWGKDNDKFLVEFLNILDGESETVYMLFTHDGMIIEK